MFEWIKSWKISTWVIVVVLFLLVISTFVYLFGSETIIRWIEYLILNRKELT